MASSASTRRWVRSSAALSGPRATFKTAAGGSLLGTQQDHGRVAGELSRRAQFNVDKTDREIMDVDQPGR